jgi:nucleoside-diphosphate-sugar epimerase
MSGAGGQPCQVLDVEDVCDAIHRCLVMRAELANDTFNIGSSDFATVRECLQAVLDSAGYGKRVIGWCPWRRVAVGADNSLSVRHSETRLDFRPRHAARAALIRQYTGYLRLHEIPCQPQPQHAPLVIFRQPTSYSTEAGVAEQ